MFVRLRGARGRRAGCTASVPAPGHAIEDRPSVAILAPRVRAGRESSAPLSTVQERGGSWVCLWAGGAA